MQQPQTSAPQARPRGLHTLSWLALSLMCGTATGAHSQSATACSPGVVDLGVLSFAETVSRTTCIQAAPVGQPGYSSEYTATFRFTLAEPASFSAYASGLFRFPSGAGEPASGIGIAFASLSYGDLLLVTGTGGGIGLAERPVLLNPSFSSLPDFMSGAKPAGTYEINLLGRGFGPTFNGVGSMGVVISTSGLPPAPVTPVPEPRTVALQLTAIGIAALLWAARRRRSPALAVPHPTSLLSRGAAPLEPRACAS